MLDKQFYPTPVSFLEKIHFDFSEFFKKCGSDESRLTVLEPSAGKGDIADWWNKGGRKYFCDAWGGENSQIDVVELDFTLRAILKDKGYNVVGDDFLSFETYKRYDLIIMNPPFANGDSHLLKAIHMQERYGGSVLCILNAETVNNPFSNSRKSLKALLDKYEAKIKFYKNAFNSDDSERKTDVEVAVVAVRIEKNISSDSKIFKELDEVKSMPNMLSDTEEEERQELIKAGFEWIDMLVKQYNEEINAGLAIIKEFVAYKQIVGERFENVRGKYDEEYLNLYIGKKKEMNDVNLFVNATRLRYWKNLFDRPEFVGKMTSKMRNEYYGSISNMQNFEFSVKNIFNLLAEVRENSLIGIEDSILALFETLTTRYSYWSECSGNIHYYNGWKSNSAYKVNKKIILPLNGYTSWGSIKELYSSLELEKTLTDLSKTFDFLSYGLYRDIDSGNDVSRAIQLNFKNGNGKNVDTKYFLLTFYKKGTCHVVIKDDIIRERLNLFVGKQKGWLPPDFGTKPYSAMDEEERKVAKSFAESEECYAEIFSNQQKYLISRENFLQIAD